MEKKTTTLEGREMGYAYLALRMYRGSTARGRFADGAWTPIDDLLAKLEDAGAEAEAEKINKSRRADYARYKRELEG